MAGAARALSAPATQAGAGGERSCWLRSRESELVSRDQEIGRKNRKGHLIQHETGFCWMQGALLLLLLQCRFLGFSWLQQYMWMCFLICQLPQLGRHGPVDKNMFCPHLVLGISLSVQSSRLRFLIYVNDPLFTGELGEDHLRSTFSKEK